MNRIALGRRAWETSLQNERDQRLNEWATALVCYTLTQSRELSRRVAELGISEDTGNKLTAAWIVFLQIRKHSPSKALELRRKYNYRRFVEMGAWWARYEFTPDDAVGHLESDLSNAAMVEQIHDAHSPNPEWHRRALAIYKPIEKMTTDLDIPEDIREWARTGKLLLARYQ